MYLHITPSFNIDRLCKTASVLLFLVSDLIIIFTTAVYPGTQVTYGQYGQGGNDVGANPGYPQPPPYPPHPGYNYPPGNGQIPPYPPHPGIIHPPGDVQIPERSREGRSDICTDCQVSKQNVVLHMANGLAY